MANEVATKPKVGITTYLTNPAVKANVAKVVGEQKSQAFISSIVSAVQTNKLLSECTNASILNAALLGESLELPHSPAMGNYFMVPYKNKDGVSEAQFQLGWKGYVQLAIRSGQYKRIVASVVKEGELKSYNPITEEISFEPILDPDARAKAKTIGYYAMLELTKGFRKEIYWSVAEMEKHASTYSQAYRNDKKWKSSRSPWTTNFDAMGKKTVLRYIISKFGVMSVKMQSAVEADMGVINDDGSVTYVDNQHDVVEEAHEAIEAGANTKEFMDVEFSEVPTADEVNADNPFAEG